MWKSALSALRHRIEYEGEKLFIFDLKVPEIFDDRKGSRRRRLTPGEITTPGQEEPVEQTSPTKGFYAGDVANSLNPHSLAKRKFFQ